MNWTTERPTESGKYWWRPSTKVVGGIVTVYETPSIGICVMATIDSMTWALPVEGLPGEWGSEIIAAPGKKGRANDG